MIEVSGYMCGEEGEEDQSRGEGKLDNYHMLSAWTRGGVGRGSGCQGGRSGHIWENVVGHDQDVLGVKLGGFRVHLAVFQKRWGGEVFFVGVSGGDEGCEWW